MAKKKNKKAYFWTSVIIWILSSWIIFTNQTLGFLKDALGINLTSETISFLSWQLLIASNLYIIWSILEKGKFPPY